ncbi:MAG: DUF5676 family membrane protein [Deferrisomatales bacterium]|nr:DUF5676 family membrane protein [Deferrisomatales bacterium]
MSKLDVKGTSCALGTSCAVLYAACVFIMLTVSKDVVIRFFNSIMHGLDVTSVMRWDMPWWEAVLGTLQMFILGWLVGALFAVLYNLAAATKK